MQDLFTSFKDNCGFGLLASIDNTPSRQNLEDAVTSLSRMIHRGAIAADGKTGDGSGLLLSIPRTFFAKKLAKEGIDLPGKYAVAVLFSRDEDDLTLFREVCEKNDLRLFYIRKVPVNTDALGEQAIESLPNMYHLFVEPNSLMGRRRFDALLYLSRKEIEKALGDKEHFYIPSFSSSVISYKGLVMPTHLKEFYVDLADPKFEISFAIFHQRFSTNTLPQWKLAQPFRMIAHNGEINSVTANRFNAVAKSEAIQSDLFNDEELARLLPIIQEGMSDSASLDNFIEFLRVNGMDFFRIARSVLPAPWQNAPHMDAELRAFYEYVSTTFESWDGPAAVSMTDGRHIGVVLDRNGLRPAKYIITQDRRLLISSEYGVLDIDEDQIVERGRLQSGEMIGLDMKYGTVLKDTDINDYLKTKEPYGKWLNEHMVYLQEYADRPVSEVESFAPEDLQAKQRYYNFTLEVLEQVIEPVVQEGKETTASMGDDTPLAAFSDTQRSFSDFFRQKFAQVTNPPIDPIREKTVMSLNTGFGEIRNILIEDAEHAKRLKTVSPILSFDKFKVLQEFGDPSDPKYDPTYRSKRYDVTYEQGLKEALDTLVEQVVSDVRDGGIRTIILDDRGVNGQLRTLPMLLSVGRINEALLEVGLRHATSIVAVSGEVYDSHKAATLIAYGASAIYPYLFYATAVELAQRGEKEVDITVLLKRLRKSMNAGLLKIMSKMGIATIASYRNSKLYDVIGLSEEVVQECFRGSHALLKGLGYQEIGARVARAHADAYNARMKNHIFPLHIGGFYKYTQGNEYHDFAPKTVHAIHHLAETGKPKDYGKLKKMIEGRGTKFIRDFFVFKETDRAIPLAEVESVEAILKRFSTAAMSLGSISPEAHESMAEAMNRLGGMSNSGEGGEDASRFGTIRNSKIKQVASGRFGVTPGYLRSAEELQIKVAQGAKPGEGGQLPGHKVNGLVAKLRHTIPGVTLISPPPHHDIYSIEDLAQLIFDLKQINPDARIAVKLVSTAGVGTIAAGVAKCYADKIIISGADGGTGAAPLTSIKHAGNPWELGLIEAHNALKANNLRGQVLLETDGGLKTGMDVVKAAIFGAERYAFGTGALTILGCKILRICHLNRCTVGIATQEEKLRDHYEGTVERLMNYFTLLAEDVREILSSIGYRSLEEVIGQTDLLEVVDNKMVKKFDFEQLLVKLDGPNTQQVERNEPFDDNAYEKGILKELGVAIKNPAEKMTLHKSIRNTNRSFGTLISGEIAKYYGDKGLPDNTINLELTGTAGQSLGAFLSQGISIRVNGAGNDYIGKGMAGGRIVITSEYGSEQFSLGGNTCLYGATSGKLYVAGQVGERFAVRNSGAIAIVEGTGDHPCEYMTGGVVVILGKTGVNFGAGMTGGVAFVLDEAHEFVENVNSELVEARRIDTDDTDIERYYLKKLLKDYYNETQSAKAKVILDDFRVKIRDFWMVQPKDMKSPLKLEEGE
jgi:glutamate synthase (NADPH/NADH) large chain